MQIYETSGNGVLKYWIENGVVMCGTDLTDPIQSAHDLETFGWAVERGMMISAQSNPFDYWNKLKSGDLFK